MQSFSQYLGGMEIVIGGWRCGSGRVSGLCLCLCAIAQDAWNTQSSSLAQGVACA